MALNIKNVEAESLAAEIAALTGETKTEAIRRALAERKGRLGVRAIRRRRGDSFVRFLEREIWPEIPSEQLGRPLSRAEEDEILGYGPDGV